MVNKESHCFLLVMYAVTQTKHPAGVSNDQGMGGMSYIHVPKRAFLREHILSLISMVQCI